MGSIVTIRRYTTATAFQLVGNAGDELLNWPFFRRSGDRAVELEVTISAGSIGFRVDGDTADRATIATSASVVTVDISDKPVGERSGKIFARSAGTVVTLLEAHLTGLEVR